MSRLRPVDRALVCLLAPLWAAAFLLTMLSLGQDLVVTPFYVAPAAPGEAPRVTGIPSWARAAPPPEQPLRVGDRLVRIEGEEIAGAGPLRVVALAKLRMGNDGALGVTALRDGRRFETTARIPATVPRWPLVPVSLAFAALGLGGILARPRLRVMQVAFPAFLCTALWTASGFGRTPVEIVAGIALQAAAVAFLVPLYARLLRHFPSGDDTGVRWARGWPALFALQGVLALDAEVYGALPVAWADPLAKGLGVASLLLFAALFTANYRRASARDRRRARWLVAGVYVATVPPATVAALSIARPELGWWFVPSQLAQLAIPLSLLASLRRFDFWDVDRLLPGALVLPAFGAGLVLWLALGVPAVAPSLARAGLSGEAGRVLLGVGAAAVLLALGAAAWSAADRAVRRDAHQLEREVDRLVADLRRCDKLREIVALLGDRLPRLWKARGAGVWARTGDWLEPVHVAGTLDDDGATDGGTSGARVHDRLDPRALAAGARFPGAAGVPVHESGAGAEDALALFAALGSKRSGDLYTSTDRALLARVGEAASGALATLRHEARLGEARLAAAALAAARDEAERASEESSALLATASHDLRQPLLALRLFVDALDERVEDAEGRALLERVRASATSMHQTFEALLDLTRLEAGALQARVEPSVALGPLLASLERDLAPEAAARGVRLRVRASALAVRSDPVFLRSILQNLATNALRYARGRVLVGARRLGADVHVQVWDDGPGIAPDEQEAIFEQGRRGAPAEASGAEGAGLGLAIVRRLSDVLGHEVTLASRPGVGSVFGIVLEGRPEEALAPAGRPEEALAPAGGAGGAAGGRGDEARPGSDGARRARSCVLILDDDRATCAALRTLLERWGIEPVTAESATAAARELAARGVEPDAVLAELRLERAPDAAADGGAGAVGALRAALRRELPACLMTAEPTREARRWARERGFPLLAKPVAPVRLRAALLHLLRGAPPPESVRSHPVRGA